MLDDGGGARGAKHRRGASFRKGGVDDSSRVSSALSAPCPCSSVPFAAGWVARGIWNVYENALGARAKPALSL